MQLILNKEIKTKQLKSELKMFAFMGAALIPTYFMLEMVVNNKNAFIVASPIFLYCLLLLVYLALRPLIDRKLIIEIHDSYTKQLMNMPFEQLSSLILDRGRHQYLIPKLLADIAWETKCWDEYALVFREDSLLKKLPNPTLEAVKAHIDQFNQSERREIQNAIFKMLSEYIIRMPPNGTLSHRIGG